MPTPQWVRDKALKRRERNCLECGVFFIASFPTAKGLCSKECRVRHTAKLRTGSKQSEETKAKRKASIAKFRAENPEAELARHAAVRAATTTPEYRAGALARYEAMLEGKVGICSDEQRDATASINKWVMKKCRAALEAETDFIEIWTNTLDRLRREFPYDGPLGTADHQEYMAKIGKMMTGDQRLRSIQDGFMREALPRFYAEYKKMKRKDGEDQCLIP